MKNRFVLTSTSSSLLVRTQFSSGNVSHRLSNRAMLSLQSESRQNAKALSPKQDPLIINCIIQSMVLKCLILLAAPTIKGADEVMLSYP